MKYTVKQIADSTGVSKTTVTRHLKRLESTAGQEYIKQNTSTDETGRINISEELAQQLQTAIIKQKEQQQTATMPPHETERTTTDHNTAPPHIAEQGATAPQHKAGQPTTDHNTQPPHDTIAALNELIETQRAQIEQQTEIIAHMKEQLTIKDKQIDSLNILFSQQQTLHLKLLETAPAQITPEEEPEKKKGFFTAFKKKK